MFLFIVRFVLDYVAYVGIQSKFHWSLSSKLKDRPDRISNIKHEDIGRNETEIHEMPLCTASVGAG